MVKEKITIFIAGDSTAQIYEDKEFPQNGWGQVLEKFFEPTCIHISNHAAGGRSSKSFIMEGRLDEILKQIKKGDYLFVQFGHNDQKNKTEDDAATLYTDPDLDKNCENSYKRYLKNYIEGARDNGANPVLLTSVTRRIFVDNEFKGIENMGNYPAAMRSLAKEMNVPLIDMMDKSARVVKMLGEYESKSLYMHIKPKDERYIQDVRFLSSIYNNSIGKTDNSHFNSYGAKLIASLVAEGIAEIGLPISKFLKKCNI